MIEIRPPSPTELDTMLALMCEAFALPFEPARELFYEDPYFEVERKRVLIEDGALVSCLTLVETPMTLGSAVVPVAGVTGVATQENRRGRGHARRLLGDTIAELAADGCGIAGLVPFSIGYYRRMGWAVGSRYLRATFPASLLPSFTDTVDIRMLRDDDWSSLARIYGRALPAHPGWCLRDERRWAYLLKHIRSAVVLEAGGVVEGYAFFDLRPDAGRVVLRLQEFVCETDRARRGILSSLAAAGAFDEVEFLTDVRGLQETGIAELVRADGAAGSLHIDTQPGVMFRLVNLENALRQLAPNFAALAEPITLVARDECGGRPARAAALLEPCADGVAVKPADPRGRDDRVIAGDIRAWIQVLTGYRSLEDAVADCDLRPGSARAVEIASPCFPRRPPHLPVTDHF